MPADELLRVCASLRLARAHLQTPRALRGADSLTRVGSCRVERIRRSPFRGPFAFQSLLRRRDRAAAMRYRILELSSFAAKAAAYAAVGMMAAILADDW